MSDSLRATSGRPRVNVRILVIAELAVPRMRSSPRVCTLVLFIHMVLMSGLGVLFTLLSLDLVFNIVYTSCSGVVELLTPCSLPATPSVIIPDHSTILR